MKYIYIYIYMYILPHPALSTRTQPEVEIVSSLAQQLYPAQRGDSSYIVGQVYFATRIHGKSQIQRPAASFKGLYV